MPDSTILGGIITAAAAIICQLLINKSNRNRQSIEEAIRDTKLDDKLTVIDHKLEEHNNYASRLAQMEQSILLMQQDIKYIKEAKFK